MRSFILLVLLLASLAPSAVGQTGMSPLTDANPSGDRWVDATLNIAQPSFTRMEIDADLTIRKYPVQGQQYSSADEIADTYLDLQQADEFARSQGQTSTRADDFVADMEQSATDAMKDILTRAFPGSPVTVSVATVDRSTMQAPDARPFEPGVALQVTATVERSLDDLGLSEYSLEDLDAILDVGAAVKTDLVLPAENGYDLTYVLAPTAGTAFTSVEGARATAAGNIEARVPLGSQGAPLKVGFRDTSAPTFDAADAVVRVKVDLRDVDVTVGQAMGGDFGDLLVDLTVAADLGVIALTDDLKASLPDGLDLDFLSSDGLRLLVDRGVLSPADLDKMEKDLLDAVGSKLGGALGGAIPVTGGFERTTFAPSLISTPLSGDEPLVFTATAKVSKPLAGGDVQPQAAIALYTTQLPLSFPKIEGLETSYTVIAPKGLAVTDVKGNGVTRGTSDDGRDQFTVTPEGETTTVTASLAVTPAFVMAKFWPLVLAFVLLLVLIVGTPIALVRMRRKKSKAAAASKK